MPSWYYVEDGQPQGPVEEADFVQLARGELIGPDTPVCEVGATEWLTLSDFSDRLGLALNSVGTYGPPPAQPSAPPSPPEAFVPPAPAPFSPGPVAPSVAAGPVSSQFEPAISAVPSGAPTPSGDPWAGSPTAPEGVAASWNAPASAPAPEPWAPEAEPVTPLADAWGMPQVEPLRPPADWGGTGGTAADAAPHTPTPDPWSSTPAPDAAPDPWTSTPAPAAAQDPWTTPAATPPTADPWSNPAPPAAAPDPWSNPATSAASAQPTAWADPAVQPMAPAAPTADSWGMPVVTPPGAQPVEPGWGLPSPAGGAPVEPSAWGMPQAPPTPQAPATPQAPTTPPAPQPGWGQPNPAYEQPQAGGYTQPAPSPYDQPGGYGQPGPPVQRDPYGQPGYGQPAYGQPAYAQPGFGQAALHPAVATATRAAFGKRFAAWLIDVAIFAVPVVPLFLLTSDIVVDDRYFKYNPGPIPLLTSLVGLLYFGLLHGSSRGQTVGKMALKIRVADRKEGGGIGLGRSVGRYLFTILMWTTCIGGILDHLWPLWDKENQTLHDKLLGTVVNEVEPKAAQPGG